jgi:hypothetical protein
MGHQLPIVLLRFGLGGAIVSLFAVVGDGFKPKTFAGLFSAAPSVALASLAIAFARDGASHASREGRSMLVGAIALFAYSLAAGPLVARRGLPVALGAALLWCAWLAVALGLWAAVLR